MSTFIDPASGAIVFKRSQEQKDIALLKKENTKLKAKLEALIKILGLEAELLDA